MTVEPSAADRVSRPQVVQRVNLTLRQSSYVSLRDLSAAEVDGMLVLTGEVPNYHMKQLAQVIAQRVEGVRHLDNRTQVQSPATAH
jgi:osmotically-inducible protein OsmY